VDGSHGQITLNEVAAYANRQRRLVGVANGYQRRRSQPDSDVDREISAKVSCRRSEPDRSCELVAGDRNDFAPRISTRVASGVFGWGFGLLGHVLALKANENYEDEDLVVSRICAPLGMESTRVSLSPSMRDRLVRGHTSILDPTPNWELGTLAGTRAIRSTANDLLVFLEATLGLRPNGQLGSAMDMLVKTSRPSFAPDVRAGLGDAAK
jgi:hypothetical protein